MNKPRLSILLAALLASGIAMAQSPANPAKTGSPEPVQAQGGSTMPAPSPAVGAPATRAEVKSEIDSRSGAKVGAPAQGGGTPSGAAMPTGSSGTSTNSRADVKAGVTSGSKAGALAQGNGTVSGAPTTNAAVSTSMERKAARAERKSERQKKRDAAARTSISGKGMDTGPASPARTAPQ